MRRITKAALRRRFDRAVDVTVGRVRAPRVTVVVRDRPSAVLLAECLESISALERVAVDVLRIDERESIRSAVARATGEYLAFADPDDVFRPAGVAALIAALSPNHGLAAGERLVLRGGQSASTPPPGSPVDLSLAAKVIRTSFWRAVDPPDVGWERQSMIVASLLAAAPSSVVEIEVVEQRERDTSLPIEKQRRFRTDLVQERIAALHSVLQGLSAASRVEWCSAAVEDLMPEMLRDSIGGGPAFLAVVRPFAAEVVATLGDDDFSEIPVAQRIASWVLAYGSLLDVALAASHLAAGRGLATNGDQAIQPEGLSLVVPASWLRVGPGDLVLRSRVHDLLPVGGEMVRLAGNAFVEYGASGLDRVLLLGSQSSVEVPVRRLRDEGANDWAARPWEDRRDSGFVAEVPLSGLPPSSDGTWVVQVVLEDQSHDHEVRLLAAPPGPTPAVNELFLGAEGLLVDGVGAPTKLRLRGAKGTTPWAGVRLDKDRFRAAVSLTTVLFDEEVPLSGGRYLFEALGRDDTALPVSLAPDLVAEPVDLVHEHMSVSPLAGEPAGLSVGPPLSAEQRSAFGLRQEITRYVGSSRRILESTVLLESFQGRVVADNPAAIGRALADRGLDGCGLDLRWVTDEPGIRVPVGTRSVPRRTRAWFDALGEAHAYVTNAAAPAWFRKAPGQLHVQTWHGTPLKKIGEDRSPGDINTWRHRRRVAEEATRWDALISPSPYCSEIFRSAFRFEGTILELGYPRNDVLLSARAVDVREETRRRLGVTAEDRVVLYAPTWREYLGVRNNKPLFLDPVRVLDALPGTVVLVRGHYNATRQPDEYAGEHRIIDVTRYPEIADLYLAADVLVTDYSSVMFDFALTDKPIVLLTPDLDQYRDVERGFYFDIEHDRPGPLVASTDEVVEHLTVDGFAAERAAFRERFCPWDDGGASRRAVDWLLQHGLGG